MGNVWVQRDVSGAVTGVYANKQGGYAEEQIASDHPDVVAYRAKLKAEMGA